MPRKARIDAPGALHHVMARGIEKRNIFHDNFDRDRFTDRMARVLAETQTPCFAWALMPNHVHILVKTGNTPISKVMHKLLAGYASGFNRRHKRHGHVFHNRYKSILCKEEPYFLELVRYIHLNPIRSKVLSNFGELAKYAYTGHKSINEKSKNEWQEVDYVLELFAKNKTVACQRYNEFIQKGIQIGRQPNLVGGGLIRSIGGWSNISMYREKGNRIKGDERILGSGDFVEDVLRQSQEWFQETYVLQSKGYDFKWLTKEVSLVLNVDLNEMMKPGRYPKRVEARSVLCYWASRLLGISTVELSKQLGIAQPTVSQSIKRGEKIVSEKQLILSISK